MPTQVTPFLEGIILFLVPYFRAIFPNPATARAECIETLASYGARTRAELINAVQIIAFNLTTLDTLAEAKESDMSLSMRLRYRGCANNLNRSSHQNETTLAKRLAADPPPPPEPAVEPINDLTEAQTQDALQQVHTRIATYRANLAKGRPTSLLDTLPAESDDLTIATWKNAMKGVLTQNLQLLRHHPPPDPPSRRNRREPHHRPAQPYGRKPQRSSAASICGGGRAIASTGELNGTWIALASKCRPPPAEP